jgi:dienelactone hydrolase
MKWACLTNTNRHEDLSCGFTRLSGAGYPASEGKYLQMKKSKEHSLSGLSPLLKVCFLTGLAILVNINVSSQQNELNVIKNNWLKYSDAPNSLYHHLTGEAYGLLKKRAENVASINSLAEWQQYQQKMRQTLLDIIVPFPAKTPLNAKSVRKIDKGSYIVEHIIFESQPGFYVTSSLFIPAGLKKRSKAPAVIYCSGHSADGYRSDVYQHILINLVKKGFVVFAFDPVGQGERLEYFDPNTGKSTAGGPTREHSYPGAQAFISGSSQARYMIWDGIRAVDYLLTRREVDPARIGITGRSGGGTQSSYIAAMDDRILAAAPENYLTNYTRLLQSIGPQDAEQNFFHGIARGFDHGDLLLVRAPKPALMITTTRDMFNIQGVLETEKEVARIYKAYGKEDNFERTEDDAPHASTKKNREAMYAFFQKQLNNPGSPLDEETQILSKEEIKVTPTGQVSTSLGGETVFSLNRKEAEKLITGLQSSRSNLTKHIELVKEAARILSGYREPSIPARPVFTGRIQRDDYAIEKYYTAGEGDYVIPYLLFKPHKPVSKALIYLHPAGKLAESAEGGEIEWFVRNGIMVLAPDLVGIGEMGPGVFKGDAYIDGNSHNIWYASILIGRSIVGVRAGDIVRLAGMLKDNFGITEIYGLSKKELSPVLVHAAVFDNSIKRIALVGPYSSYSSIVMNRYYNQAFIHSTVAAALKSYDLPDLAASLAPRKLLITGVTDGEGKINESVKIYGEPDLLKEAYERMNSLTQLSIVPDEISEKPFAVYSDWIK